MTEGQLRFRSLMEDQRHNLAMERFEKEKSAAQTSQAATAAENARINAFNAETNALNARTRQQELQQVKTQMGWDIGFKFASFLFPDANTALKSGAQVISGLFS